MAAGFGAAAASDGLAPAAVARPPVADTVLRSDLSLPPATVVYGITAAPEAPGLDLGLRRIPMRGLSFDPPTLRRPSLFPAGTGLPPFAVTALRLRAADPLRTPVTGVEALLLPERPIRLAGEPPELGREAITRFSNRYVDLSLDLRSRLELGGEWNRFTPCDDALRESCTPNLVPRLSPDTRFGVRLEGSVLDRVMIDVDFDQAREFGGENRINIAYEGAEDDILSSLNVGDVTFDFPRSRFLTDAVPAGNFGFRADGQLGPLEFQSVWAQQRGDLNTRVFRLSGIGDRRSFVQEDTVDIDDADYARGQFFYIVDPVHITDYPHFDPLQLHTASAPSSVSPGIDPVQIYRLEDDPALLQQVEGYIQADAVVEADGERIVESGWFRLLLPGIDYFLHPSGLWLALRAPLASDEMLATTFVTATGDTVGSFDPEAVHNAGGRPQLRLLRAPEVSHQPGSPSWRHEMHSVYRVSGSDDVEPGSVGLTVSLGELSAGRTFKRSTAGEDVTFLSLFGLDEEAPSDELDPAAVFSLSDDEFGAIAPVRGSYIFFPAQKPFARPPPSPVLRLDTEEAARLLGDDANFRIYEEEDPFERANAGRFRLRISYRLRSEGVISSFSLGALGVRPGSERVHLGDRILVAGEDYDIDYDLGQVTLLDPERLFTTAPDAEVRVSWEQQSLFRLSPTQVLGLRTRAGLGGGGEINLLTLYRSERSPFQRPTLGTEPRAALLGGLGLRYEGSALWLDRLIGGLPGVRTSGSGGFVFEGEMAASLPNPNTARFAFLDDFDGSAHSAVSLFAQEWQHGSAPTRRTGAEDVLPRTYEVANAAALVWQHTWTLSSPSGDSLGLHEGYFPHLDIDRRIRVAGSERREPGLLLSFRGRPSAGGASESSWRSLTTVLATSGLDLTRTEFLEFYADGDDGVTLVIDIGTVSEDAFVFDDAGRLSGTRSSDGRRWGEGELDQEADPGRGEIWGDDADARGVWNESCAAERGRVYRIGDPNAVCTKGNGRADSEDLDNDGNLDTSERHLRFVLRLDGSSEFLARSSAETETPFELYRVPIGGAGAFEVGGSFTDAHLRAVRHMRITVVGTGRTSVRLARMRLVGSRWVKRAATGVLAGIAGDERAFGRVEVGEVSRLTEGELYSPPPGVLEALADPNLAFAGEGIEFNERALAISFDGLASDSRAEVYHRFTQRSRNFLDYREARLWVTARNGDFGHSAAHGFFLKAGTDPENFYLFRARLPEPGGSEMVVADDWLPELRIDFEEWLDLRQAAEEMLIRRPLGTREAPIELWSADSTYAVVLSDRGRAPSLAAVREVAIGVWNQEAAPVSGEVWVNELRLGSPLRDFGAASSLDLRIDGGGVFEASASVTGRGAYFRQLRDEPTYQDDRSVNLVSTLALDRFAPAAWGIELPLVFERRSSRREPLLLAESDVRADRIQGLRVPHSNTTRIGLSFRKTSTSTGPVADGLFDGVVARVSYLAADGATIATSHESSNLDAGVEWALHPEGRFLRLVPSFVRGVLAALLPGALEDRVLDTRLRVSPVRMSVGVGYARHDGFVERYPRIIDHPDDEFATRTPVALEVLETVADLRLQPLGSLSADIAFVASRDLLPPKEASPDRLVQRLLERERLLPLGLNLGWETYRSIITSLAYSPEFTEWLGGSLRLNTRFLTDRSPQFFKESSAGPRNATLLTGTRDASARRDLRTDLVFDPVGFADALPGSGSGASAWNAIRRLLSSFQPVNVTYDAGVNSRFDRDPVSPGISYQFGWGSAEDLRFLDADTAAALTETRGWAVTGGLALPGGLSLISVFRDTDFSTLDARSDRQGRERRWPDLRMSLPSIAMPGWSGMRRLALSGGIARRTVESTFGGGLQRRYQETTDIPASVTVAWRGSVTTSYQTSISAGSATDPTGELRPDRHSHRVSFSSRFLPPWGLAELLDRPIDISLLGLLFSESNCRLTATVEECVAFLDRETRSLSLSLEAAVNEFELGMQFSYDDRRSYVGQRPGATNFRVLLFGEMRVSSVR